MKIIANPDGSMTIDGEWDIILSKDILKIEGWDYLVSKKQPKVVITRFIQLNINDYPRKKLLKKISFFLESLDERKEG